MSHYLTYLTDTAVLTGIAVGYIAFFVGASIVVARIGIGIDQFVHRNDR